MQPTTPRPDIRVSNYKGHGSQMSSLGSVHSTQQKFHFILNNDFNEIELSGQILKTVDKRLKSTSVSVVIRNGRNELQHIDIDDILALSPLTEGLNYKCIAIKQLKNHCVCTVNVFSK